MNLCQVGQLRECLGVSKRDKDNAVVGQGADGVGDGGLLPSSRCASGNEDTSIFVGEATGGPKPAGSIPEGLPLSGEVTVAGGDTEEEGVEVLKFVDGNYWVLRLGWCMHFGKDFRWQSLGDSDDDLIRLYRQEIRNTDWWILADPPADSTPALTASATERFVSLDHTMHRFKRTFGDVTVHRVDD